MDPNQTPPVPTFSPPAQWNSDPTPPSEQWTQPETSRPTPSTPPLPAQTAPSSSKKSGFLKTFFIIIALILFGTLVGVLAARFLPMTSSTPTSAPTSIPTPTELVTPVATQSAMTEETAIKLRSEVENWSSYVKSATKLTWDACAKESSVSANLKKAMITASVSIKEIDGVKLAISPNSGFSSSDITEFIVCEAGAYSPIYASPDYILWVSPCSTGIAPENISCEDTLSQIKKLYQ